MCDAVHTCRLQSMALCVRSAVRGRKRTEGGKPTIPMLIATAFGAASRQFRCQSLALSSLSLEFRRWRHHTKACGLVALQYARQQPATDSCAPSHEYS
jgi:hypothetical protein